MGSRGGAQETVLEQHIIQRERDIRPLADVEMSVYAASTRSGILRTRAT